MVVRSTVSRRDVLGLGVAAGGLLLTPLLVQAATSRTPAQILGPFYPVDKPLDQDTDLTRIAGKSARAKGELIEITGRVLDQAGRPISGARMEIWQANSYGRYTHPADTNEAPLDPNFEGYALLTTDSEGRYRFKTIKPGAYPQERGGPLRPPHIHFDVASRKCRLVTQLYFAGEPLNESDRVLGSARDPSMLITTLQRTDASEPAIGRWDIVLDQG